MFERKEKRGKEKEGNKREGGRNRERKGEKRVKGQNPSKRGGTIIKCFPAWGNFIVLSSEPAISLLGNVICFTAETLNFTPLMHNISRIMATTGAHS